MDQTTVLWLFGVSLTLMGGILGAIWHHATTTHAEIFKRIQANEKAVADTALDMAKNYVSSPELDKIVTRLERTLASGLTEVSASLNNLTEQFHAHQLDERRPVPPA